MNTMENVINEQIQTNKNTTNYLNHGKLKTHFTQKIYLNHIVVNVKITIYPSSHIYNTDVAEKLRFATQYKTVGDTSHSRKNT